jgi:hypothetical protein
MVTETELAASRDVVNPIADDPDVRTVLWNSTISHLDCGPTVGTADVKPDQINVACKDQDRGGRLSSRD